MSILNDDPYATKRNCIVHDTTGQYTLNPDELANVMTYAGPGGAVDTITVGPDLQGFSFKQTLTYTGSNLTTVSGWVKQ